MAKPKFTGELIHFGAARLRINGSGIFQSILHSLDNVKSYIMPNITMQSSTDIQPLILSNFISQRGYLEFKTTNIDETFAINKITIFVKSVASGIPQ